MIILQPVFIMLLESMINVSVKRNSTAAPSSGTIPSEPMFGILAKCAIFLNSSFKLSSLFME